MCIVDLSCFFNCDDVVYWVVVDYLSSIMLLGEGIVELVCIIVC